MQQQWLNQKALTTRFTLFDGTSPAQVTAMTPHTGALFRRSQRGRQWYSAVTSMVPTMLAFRAGRPAYLARRDRSELVVLAAMTLARISLASGRPVELTSLTISSTYGGLLEGYPNTRMNDALIARLRSRRESAYSSQPAHVITPPRSRPGPDQGSARMPFGPVETLPAVYCEGSFRSGPVDEELDPVLHESRLMVVWFQEDLARPVADSAAAAVHGLAWDDLAEDTER
jgi:hypothetical protein